MKTREIILILIAAAFGGVAIVTWSGEEAANQRAAKISKEEARIDWSRPAVYTVAFFVFWAVTAVACSLSLWLALPPQDALRSRSAD